MSVETFLHLKLCFKLEVLAVIISFGWEQHTSIYKVVQSVRHLARERGYMDLLNPSIIIFPESASEYSKFFGAKILHIREIKVRLLNHMILPFVEEHVNTFRLFANSTQSWLENPVCRDEIVFKWPMELVLALRLPSDYLPMKIVYRAVYRYVQDKPDCISAENISIANISGCTLGKVLCVNFLSTKEVHDCLHKLRRCIYLAPCTEGRGD